MDVTGGDENTDLDGNERRLPERAEGKTGERGRDGTARRRWAITVKSLVNAPLRVLIEYLEYG